MNNKNIQFFTWDIDAHWDYALVPYHKFYPKMIEKYKEMIIDCGVDKWLNSKNNEYPYLEEFEQKVLKYGSEKVKFIIPDYPTDILKSKIERIQYRKIFLERTERNIKRFQALPNTILSLQYEFENFDSFKNSWDKFYDLGDYMAIGNLCKSKNQTFFRKVLKFVIKKNHKNKPIHFFGIGIPLFKVLCLFDFSFKISFDTTKWSFTDNSKLRKKVGGYICKYPYRQEFLDNYIEKLQNIENKIRNRIKLTDYI